MDSLPFYRAPWGRQLKIITLLVSILLLGLPLYLYFLNVQKQNFNELLLILMPAVVLLCALFMIRGYTFDSRTLYIQRLFWRTSIDLLNLQSVLIDPQATTASIRTFGNGGFFSFSGKFRNKKIGSYRAFVTDHRLTIVLSFSDRKIVISPENPQQFEQQLKMMLGLK